MFSVAEPSNRSKTQVPRPRRVRREIFAMRVSDRTAINRRRATGREECWRGSTCDNRPGREKDYFNGPSSGLRAVRYSKPLPDNDLSALWKKARFLRQMVSCAQLLLDRFRRRILLCRRGRFVDGLRLRHISTAKVYYVRMTGEDIRLGLGALRRPICESGGIGRRAGLRIQWGNPCRFNSCLSHLPMQFHAACCC